MPVTTVKRKTLNRVHKYIALAIESLKLEIEDEKEKKLKPDTNLKATLKKLEDFLEKDGFIKYLKSVK